MEDFLEIFLERAEVVIFMLVLRHSESFYCLLMDFDCYWLRFFTSIFRLQGFFCLFIPKCEWWWSGGGITRSLVVELTGSCLMKSDFSSNWCYIYWRDLAKCFILEVLLCGLFVMMMMLRVSHRPLWWTIYRWIENFEAAILTSIMSFANKPT